MTNKFEVTVKLDKWAGKTTASLSVTHNGHSWTSIRLNSQDEINSVIDALKNFKGLMTDYYKAFKDDDIPF